MKKSAKTLRQPSGISQVTSSFDQAGKTFSRTANFTFEKEPGKVYVEVRAISARVNRNFDGFRSAELKKAYTSFIGRPVFVNHVNHDHMRTRGVIKDSKYLENGDDKYISLLIEVDAVNFPKLAAELEKGDLDSVSMGCDVEASACSYCGNVASAVDDFCDHVMYHKGEVLDHPEKGPTLVYEDCQGLNFFEISFVFDPADETALAERIISTAAKKAAKRALRDVIAPPEVDTLREESICPQCGDENFDGNTCEFCQYTSPLDELGDPDVDVAREVDIRQDQEEGVPAESDPRKEGPRNMPKNTPNNALARALAARNVAAAKRRLAVDTDSIDEDLTPVPSAESPTDTTKEKRNDETSTDVTDIDESVLTDTKPDAREDVTKLDTNARRRSARRLAARRKVASSLSVGDKVRLVSDIQTGSGITYPAGLIGEVKDDTYADSDRYSINFNNDPNAPSIPGTDLKQIVLDSGSVEKTARRKTAFEVGDKVEVTNAGSEAGIEVGEEGKVVETKDGKCSVEMDSDGAKFTINNGNLKAVSRYRSARRRKADVDKTDESARKPEDRVDPEKPVSNTNDEESQESQYDENDFDRNQGDNKRKMDDGNTTVVPGKTQSARRARRKRAGTSFVDKDYNVWMQQGDSWVHNDGNGNSETMSDADAQNMINSQGLTVSDSDDAYNEYQKRKNSSVKTASVYCHNKDCPDLLYPRPDGTDECPECGGKMSEKDTTSVGKDARSKTASITQVIALLDAYDSLGLIAEGQRYNKTAEFERLPAVIAKDRLTLLDSVIRASKRRATASTSTKPSRPRGVVPTAAGGARKPAMGQASTPKTSSASSADDFLTFL